MSVKNQAPAIAAIRAGPAAVTAQGLTKRYGKRLAVDGLGFEVPTGVVAGFVGPNGAGKTTAMAMLLGLIRPTSGTGTVLGHPVTKPGAYLRRVGALIETPAFYPALTGRQNLSALATLAGHDHAQIAELLDLVGLGARGADRFGTYSLGMKQRLGIAASLLGDPQLLILDEPTNGLDPAGIAEVRDLIARLARNDRTILISSHVLAEVEQICNWLVVIDHGRLIFQGPAADLVDSAVTGLAVAGQHPGDLVGLHRILTADGHRVQANQADQAELIVEVGQDDACQLAATINRAAFQGGVVLTELRAVRANLEDHYLSMVTGGDR